MKRFFRDNGLLLIIIAALLAAVLAVSASFLGTSPLANLLGLLATPFRSVSSAVADWSREDRTTGPAYMMTFFQMTPWVRSICRTPFASCTPRSAGQETAEGKLTTS